MYLISEKISLLDDLLNRIAAKLQLDDTRRKIAEERYNSVTNWLKSDEEFWGNYELNIYGQGSYRLGTTVKPRAREEYDLDFVMEVDLNYLNYTPEFILKKLEECLRKNKLYDGKVEPKKRCVCLNYSGDFHMDIIPAAPKFQFGGDEIKISDRKKHEWIDSNPKGYTEWFESNYVKQLIIEEKRASVEKLPDAPPYDFIQPLQRTVQLFKRHRDIFFENENEDYSTRSIVITTLCGHAYNSEESENLAITNILKLLYDKTQQHNNPFSIPNPAGGSEDFGDYWKEKPHVYQQFRKFISNFYRVWNELNNAVGIDEISKKLEILFGEHISRDVLTEQTKYINSLRKAGLLGATNLGLISTQKEKTSNVINKNTFYG